MVLHIFLAIILSFRIYAGDTVAEVILVKGQVTKLYPGTLKALEVKLGDKLPEDTSLATAERSIVRVKYSDGSQVTIGPKGHVNLVMASKKGSGLISLLKGKIRSQVMKNGDSQKTKLIIKTRNAALGVRGTDFQTVYNPANKNTSLVTFDGEVAMKKVSDKEILKKSIETSTTPTKAPVQNFEDYDKIIDKNNVLVKKGRFSGVSQQATQATNPIKINPKQYVALKKSNEFNISKKPIEITDKEVEQAAKEMNKIKDLTPTTDLSTLPKAGGFIDMNSAMYIAPTKNAVFNDKLGVFEDDSIGGIANGSSEYVPPPGVKLDEKKGFVLDQSLDKEKQKEAQEKIANLNNSLIGGDSPQNNNNKIVPTTPAWYSPKAHIFTFKIGGSGQHVTVKPTTSNEEYVYDSEDGFILGITYSQKWSEKWSSFIYFELENYGYNTINYNNAEGAQNTFSKDQLYNRKDGGEKTEQFRLGLIYSFYSKLKFLAFINLGSHNYVDAETRDSSNTYLKEIYINDKNSDGLGLGLNWTFIEKQTWSFNTELILKKIFSSNEPYCNDCMEKGMETEFKSGTGMELALATFYKISEKKKLYLELRVKNDRFEIERPNSYQTSGVETVESSTSSGELSLNYQLEI